MYEIKFRNAHLRIKISDNSLTQNFDVASFRHIYNYKYDSYRYVSSPYVGTLVNFSR